MSTSNQIQAFLNYAKENQTSKAAKVVAGVEFFKNKDNDQLWSKVFTLKEFFEDNIGELPSLSDTAFFAGSISGALQKSITEDDIIANPSGFGVSIFLGDNDGKEVLIPMLHRVGTLKKSKITSFDQLR